MSVVGSPRARRGRLALLAAVAAGIAAVVLTGSSSAASGRAQGIDVSNWNGSIKWSKVAAAGYSFTFGKATEGTTFTDGTYTTNRDGSEAAGLVFGAYHFARPSGASIAAVTASATAQADYFLSVADPQPGELPPVLDLEKTGKLKPKFLTAWTQAWVNEIFARLGVEPFIYSSPDFWKSYLADSPSIAASGALLWIAHWTKNSQPEVPADNWNGTGWTFWQWTDCLSVPGIAHCTDGDRMHGTQPSSVAIQPYDTTDPPALSTPASIAGPPEAGQLLAALPGTWVGGKPLAFTYQWKRCDAAGANCVSIPGATHESYRPVSADVGHSLKVFETATAATGSVSTTTPPTVSVSPAGTPPSARPENIDPPTISGEAQVGQILTSSVGTWSGSPTKFAYRWQRCDATGLNCVAIAKATHATYTLTPDDLGATDALVVTATGAGGATSAHAAPTAVVAAAPLPPVSTGSQLVEQGVAGNVQTEDARAVATWQPGSVPVGLTFSLGTSGGVLSVQGTEVSVSVPGLPASGFPWPVDVGYAVALPQNTVLGYSGDGSAYYAVTALRGPVLPAGKTVGWYADPNGLPHVLMRMPFQLAAFTMGAWADPRYTSPTGPSLPRRAKVQALLHRADQTVLVLARLSAKSQTRLAATITSAGGKKLGILPKGSRLGTPLPAGRPVHTVKVELDKPGSIVVRLRLNGRTLAPGRYALRITAVDPWGRSSVVKLPFSYR